MVNTAKRVIPLNGALQPDIDETRRFIKHMMGSGDASFTSQTFDDKKVRDDLATIHHGNIYEQAARLSRLQADGAGVFWMVNQGDGKGRKTHNVTAVRALFADTDGAPLEPIIESLRPHAIVESSPGNWHVYYRVEDCPLELFTVLQKAISRRFGTDHKVIDRPRVLRLPGFLHQKYDPFMVRIVELNEIRPYTVTEITFDLLDGEVEEDNRTSVTVLANRTGGEALANLDPREPRTEAKVALVREALATIDPDPRDVYLRILMALQSTGWADWQEMAEEWADGTMWGESCAKFDASAFARDCKGLTVDRGVTLGTLFEYAAQAGWKDPRNDVALHDYHGDADNGQRFARKHRGEFLYVHSDSLWLRWDGLRWARCESGEERIAARRVALEGLDEAQAAMRANPTDRTRNDWQQATAVFRNEKRHEALLRVASTEPGMSIGNPGKLDADPLLLGVRNGVVDLRLGTLLAADPKMLISRQAGAAFDRAAQCPQWLAFLDAVFEGDAELINFVQRAVGYALTGLVDEEKMFFLFGNGANGKSVLANVLHALFGNYAVNVRAAMLTRDLRGQNAEGEREKVRLPGARLALINEVGSHDLFDDARLKELVARDPIGARALYGESYEFLPTHTIFLRGNHQPGAVDSGDAFWRRLVLIPFNRQFAEHERVPDLERRILDNERDGILTWIVDGCLAWQRSGLRIPAAVRNASDEYRRDTDLLGEWIDGHCKCGRNEVAMVGALYEAYCRFLREAGVSTPSRAVFGRQIQGRGFRGRKTTGGKRLIEGLSPRNWGEDEGDEL